MVQYAHCTVAPNRLRRVRAELHLSLPLIRSCAVGHSSICPKRHLFKKVASDAPSRALVSPPPRRHHLLQFTQRPHVEWGFLGGSVVKNLPAVQETLETWVQFPGQEDPLEEEMATHSSFLAWREAWPATVSGITKSQTRLSS